VSTAVASLPAGSAAARAGSHRSARWPDRPGRRTQPHLRRPRIDRHQPGTPRAARSARGLSGRRHPGSDQARPTCPIPARCRAIADELTARHVSLSLGASVYDPHDAVGRSLFNVLAMVAEFEADLIRLRTKEGMRVAKAKGRLRGRRPKLNARQEAHLVSLIAAGEHRSRGPVRGQPPHGLPRPTAQQKRHNVLNPHCGLPRASFPVGHERRRPTGGISLC